MTRTKSVVEVRSCICSQDVFLQYLCDVCGGLLAPPPQVCDQFGCDGRARVEQLLGMEVSSKYKKRTKWDLLLETM